MPIISWLLYADHEVAPICRSVTRVKAGNESRNQLASAASVTRLHNTVDELKSGA
jgi:hypothetical protein